MKISGRSRLRVRLLRKEVQSNNGGMKDVVLKKLLREVVEERVQYNSGRSRSRERL